MSATRTAFIFAILSLLAFLVVPVRGQSGIVVNGADGIRTESVAPSAGLETVLNGVLARVSVQYANRLRHMEMNAPPSPFQALLSTVSQRVSVQYANRTRHDTLVIPTETLNVVLNAVSDRVMFQYANRNRLLSLTYPRDLLNDQTAPAISAPASAVEGSNVRLTWTTNEFTRCTLRYGTQSGAYTDTFEEVLYARQHEQFLPEAASSDYFVQITCLDQSDNAAVSPEFGFTTSSALFLPLVQK